MHIVSRHPGSVLPSPGTQKPFGFVLSRAPTIPARIRSPLPPARPGRDGVSERVHTFSAAARYAGSGLSPCSASVTSANLIACSSLLPLPRLAVQGGVQALLDEAL